MCIRDSLGLDPITTMLGMQNGASLGLFLSPISPIMVGVAGVAHIKSCILYTSDPKSLISKITMAEAEQLKVDGIIAGGMIPKVDCCLEAIKSGAQKVFIINGEIPHAILIELLTDEGLGTMFVK